MIRAKAVHQCLFCPQTFGSAVEKDDHILEHFAQETCSDCDQSIIRIGSHTYTIHDVVTCVKRESKPDVTIWNQSHNRPIDQNHDNRDYYATPTSPHAFPDEQMCIKVEPDIEEMCHLGEHEAFSNQNSDENMTAFNATPSNAVTVHPLELKMDPGAQDEQCTSADVKNDMDFDSSQASKSQSYLTSENTPKEANRYQCLICKAALKTWSSLNRHMDTKHDPNCVTFKCGYCWSLFMSKRSLDNHLPRCKRAKKSIDKTKKLHTDPQGMLCSDGSNNDEHSADLKIGTDTGRAEFNSNQFFSESTAKLPKASKKRYQDERVPCEICGEKFLPFYMDRHKIYKHRPEVIQCEKYECAVCQRVLNNRKSFLQHMRLKHNSKIFKCHLCSVVLMSKESLDNHHRLRCKRIEDTSHETAQSEFISTNTTMNDEKDRYCEICEKSFARANGCERHKFRVHKIGGHHCIKCKQVFHTALGLINHGPKCKQNLNATFECYICRNKYHSKRYLRFHIKSVHLPYEKKFECETCSKHFSSKSLCESHKNRVHLDIRNFICSTCGRAFTSNANLSQHERVHTGAKPIKCSFEGCGQSFRTHSAKYAHQHIHRGQKAFRCKVDGCNEQFGGRTGFKKHRKNVHGIC